MRWDNLDRLPGTSAPTRRGSKLPMRVVTLKPLSAPAPFGDARAPSSGAESAAPAPSRGPPGVPAGLARESLQSLAPKFFATEEQAALPGRARDRPERNGVSPTRLRSSQAERVSMKGWLPDAPIDRLTASFSEVAEPVRTRAAVWRPRDRATATSRAGAAGGAGALSRRSRISLRYGQVHGAADRTGR
jgi:hypothetical protein